MRVISILFVAVSLVVHGTLLANDFVAADDLALQGIHRGQKSALDDKRLFFTAVERGAMQREAGTLSGEAAPETGEVLSIAETAKPMQVDPESVSSVRFRNSKIISYQARIRSAHMIRVVVNGSPCQRVTHVENVLQDSGWDIQCHGLKLRDVRLTLLADGVRLQVTDGAIALGTLRPGESL